jgi:hypothetical protein
MASDALVPNDGNGARRQTDLFAQIDDLTRRIEELPESPRKIRLREYLADIKSRVSALTSGTASLLPAAQNSHDIHAAGSMSPDHGTIPTTS